MEVKLYVLLTKHLPILFRTRKVFLPIILNLIQIFTIVLVPYVDSALNMDTPNIFKSNKFYRHMALRARKEKQMKR